MPQRDFDLQINFKTPGIENVDRANQKLDALAKKLDDAQTHATKVAAATQRLATQSAQSAQQAAQSAAQHWQNAANQTAQAYKGLLQTIQQVNQAMQRAPGRVGGGGGNGGGGGGNNSPNANPNRNTGGGRPGPNPFFTTSGILRGFGLGYGGYEVIRRVVVELKNMLPEAARNARQLQNLSEEMGITSQQAFRLQSAAKLAGVDLGTMGMAARRLGSALSDPAGAGKKAATELSQLGISLRQSLGGALDDTLHKLAAMEDPGKRAAAAFALFGRAGAQVNIMAENLRHSEEVMREWGLSLNENVQQRLVDANATLQAVSIRFALLKAQFASGIILPIVNFAIGAASSDKSVVGAKPMPSPYDKYSALHGNTGAYAQSLIPPFPSVPGAPAGLSPSRATEAQANALDRLLGDDSKMGLQERLAKAKADLATSEAYAKNDALLVFNHSDKSPTSQRVAMDKAEVVEKRALVASLQQQLKSVDKNTTLLDQWSSVLERMKDRANTVVAGEKGPLASFDTQRSAALRKFASIAPPMSSRWLDYMAASGIVRDSLLRQQSGKASDLALKWGETEGQIPAEVFLGQAKFYGGEINSGLGRGDELTKSLFGLPQITTLPPGFSARQNAQLSRMLTGGSARIQSTLAGPGGEGMAAATSLHLRLQEVEAARQEAVEQAKILEGAKQVNAVMAANFEARKGQYEAVIQYEQQLAEIRKSQLNETRNFTSGFFQASLQGNGAPGNFLRSWATGMAGHIVGNLGAETIGTLNSHLSLQRNGAAPGIMGTAAHPNFLGRILAGTPFGFDPSKGDGMAQPLDRNSQITAQNTAIVASNNQLIASLVSVLGQASGIDTTSLPGVATTVGSAPIANGPALPGFSLSLPNLGGFSGGGGGSTSLPSLLPHITSLPGIPQGTSGGFMGALGSLMGGAGIAASGHALQGIFTGGVDNGDGTGEALNGFQRIGAAAALAGGAYAGISQAIRGFGKGGGRGITGGIGSALGTAAMFDPDPLSHGILSAGAGIMGLVSKLFGDPRQERITNEQHTLVHDAFVQPAAHDYNFGSTGSGGAGFSFADGGGIRAGGSNATYHVSIQAMDAHSFVDWGKNNPTAFAQAMLYGVQQGGVAALDSEMALRASQTGFFG